MHLMPKCILAYIFQRKMFSVHFPKENVHFSFGKCSAYIFLWKMFSVHFPLENVQHQQNVTNFDAKMHLMPKKCLQRAKMHFPFSKGKCSAYIFQRKMFSVHFPLENVQQTKMLESGQHKKHQTQHLMQKCICNI